MYMDYNIKLSEISAILYYNLYLKNFLKKTLDKSNSF